MLKKMDAPARKYSLYFLRDPRDSRLVYIGISSDPKRRLTHHKSASTSPGLRALVAELKGHGLGLAMQIVFSGLTEKQALRAEMRLCFLHSQFYYNRLFNTPVHCTKSNSTCAIGPRHGFYKSETVTCDECGIEQTFQQKHRHRYIGAVFAGSQVYYFCRPCMKKQFYDISSQDSLSSTGAAS